MASYLLTEVAEEHRDRGSLTRAHKDLDLAEPFLRLSDDASNLPIYLTVRAKAYLAMAWINSPSPDDASEQALRRRLRRRQAKHSNFVARRSKRHLGPGEADGGAGGCDAGSVSAGMGPISQQEFVTCAVRVPNTSARATQPW